MSNLDDENDIVKGIFNNDLDYIKNSIANGDNVNVCDFERRSPLHAAAFLGNTAIIELLISEGAEVNAKDSKWLTPLHRACASRNYDAVRTLLDNRADVNVRDKFWQSPLHVAAANNAVQCADYLLPHLNNLNFSDRGGHTALHHAALSGHVDMVKLLLGKGATVSAYDRQERRAIHWAACKGYCEIVHMLVDHGADINCKDKVNGDTPAHAAAAAGQIHTLKTILELGYEVDIENNTNNTALHIACKNGHDDLVQVLLENGADVNKRCKTDSTPLHYAAMSLHGDITVELLISKSACLDLQDNKGKTPLHLASYFGREKRLETLLNYKANFEILDNQGNSPLHLAASRGNNMVVSLLLNAGADPFCRDASGRLPLHVAALNSKVEVCKKLLQAAVTIDEGATALEIISLCDMYGRSSIHHAACSGSLECIEVFLTYTCGPELVLGVDEEKRMPLHYAMGSADADCVRTLLAAAKQQNALDECVNHCDKDGRTPLLHGAASDEFGRCVELIIPYDADILQEDNFGVNALHYAAAGGHCRAVRLLIEATPEVVDKTHVSDLECPTPLHLASFYGHVKVVDLLSKEIRDSNDLSLDVCDLLGRSALELASYQSNTSCAKVLILNGASPAYVNPLTKATALHMAAARGHEKMMEIVIEGLRDLQVEEKVCDFINFKDDDSCTPLMYSVTNGHHSCVDYLLSQNASLWPDDKFGCTVLHRGAVSSFEDVICSLLRHAESEGLCDEFADMHVDGIHASNYTDILEAKSSNGRTALHFAAIRGNSSILESILMLTQNVNSIDKFGYTPLHYACLEGHEPCVDALISHDSFCEFNGSTFSPLHCAVFNDNESCADRLLEVMGDDLINLKDRKGRTPLHVCAFNDIEDCTKLLLRHSADVNATDFQKRTPLMTAIHKASQNCFEVIMYHCSNTDFEPLRLDLVDAELTDCEGNNLLHIACLLNDIPSGMRILDHYLDLPLTVINGQNKEFKTPLHIAARKGLTDMVSKLVELGASVNIYDHEGCTPALACAPNGNVADCLDLLISCMLARNSNPADSTTASVCTNFESIREERRASTEPEKPLRRLSHMYMKTSSPVKVEQKTLVVPTEESDKKVESDSDTY